MQTHKILVCDNFGEEFLNELTKFGIVIQANDIDYSLPLDEFTILVVRSKTKVNKELIDIMRSLECVITATHGIDHIDLGYLEEKGIKFFNIPVQSYDVAQGVIAYLLAYVTNLVEGDRSMKRGIWKKKSLIGCRIKGKTLGIIGCGKIGREVAQLGFALRMKVIACDPCLSDDKIVVVSLEELLKKSDFITIHTPLTEETSHLIGRKEIAKMKDGAYLVNTARGGIIDEEALLEAVRSGKIGAALDVYEYESPPFSNEVSNNLVKSEKVIATPHSIGQTIEAIEEKGKGVLKAVKDYIAASRNTTKT